MGFDGKTLHKNWKTQLTYWVIVIMYPFSIIVNKSDNVVESAGYFAIIAFVLFMLRDETVKELAKTLIESIKRK